MEKLPYNESFIRPERIEIRAKGVRGAIAFCIYPTRT